MWVPPCFNRLCWSTDIQNRLPVLAARAEPGPQGVQGAQLGCGAQAGDTQAADVEQGLQGSLQRDGKGGQG